MRTYMKNGEGKNEFNVFICYNKAQSSDKTSPLGLGTTGIMWNYVDKECNTDM